MGKVDFVFTSVMYFVMLQLAMVSFDAAYRKCTFLFSHQSIFFQIMHSLVSTYIVCERLSVMHEPAVVVENLVQILQNTPNL